MGYRLFDQTSHVLVLDHVEDPSPDSAGSDQTRQAELGQVLGNPGWLRTDVGGEIAYRVFSVQ